MLNLKAKADIDLLKLSFNSSIEPADCNIHSAINVSYFACNP